MHVAASHSNMVALQVLLTVAMRAFNTSTEAGLGPSDASAASISVSADGTHTQRSIDSSGAANGQFTRVGRSLHERCKDFLVAKDALQVTQCFPPKTLV
jgi:hypothetical protein